ncbi:hypothetical protein [Deinococcus sp. PEB2-63]
MTNILLIAALLTDPDRTPHHLNDWDAELHDLRREDASASTTMHAFHIVAHTAWELRRWPDLTERHRAAIINVAARLTYLTLVVAAAVAATTGLIRGDLAGLAALLILLGPWPIMAASWSSDPYVLDLPYVNKRSSLHAMYGGIAGLVLALVVWPWIAKIIPAALLYAIGQALYGEQLAAWWERVTWRD